MLASYEQLVSALLRLQAWWLPVAGHSAGMAAHRGAVPHKLSPDTPQPVPSILQPITDDVQAAAVALLKHLLCHGGCARATAVHSSTVKVRADKTPAGYPLAEPYKLVHI